MKNNTIFEIEERINKVKEKIGDVKSFKNLKLFSSIKIYDNHFLIVYDPGTLSYNFFDKNHLSVKNPPSQSLHDVRKHCEHIGKHSNLILEGEPLIEDLNEDLELLNDLLHIEYMKITDDTPKIINITDAPDGWYRIKHRPHAYDSLTREGDLIFIKAGIVYVENHKRFVDDLDMNQYCIKGFHQMLWDGYTCIKN